MEESSRLYEQAAPHLHGNLGASCWYRIERNALRLEDAGGVEQAFAHIPDRLPAMFLAARQRIREGRLSDAEPLVEQLERAAPQTLEPSCCGERSPKLPDTRNRRGPPGTVRSDGRESWI
jgi:hypothetical protein